MPALYAAAALELASDEEAVRQLCARAYCTWQEMIATHLAARGVAEAQEHAEQVLCAVEGALVLARTHRDAGVVRRASARVAAALTVRVH
jgi:TetR/AcrR family transcriptional repressor of lmrAB and yxaGH operons